MRSNVKIRTPMYNRMAFRPFMESMRWKQGEHILLASPTGTGKTTLAAQLIRKRSHVVVLASKTRDSTIQQSFRDCERITEWPPRYDTNRVLLWPKNKGDLADVIAVQRIEFKSCLNDVGKMGGWCVVIDEAHWLSQFLKLDKEIAILHHQGRSSGVSMVVCTQRPAWIPRIVYSSASHVFLGQTASKDDIKSLASLGGVDAPQVLDTVQHIGRHDLLYLNPMGDHAPVVINTRK